VRSEVIASPDHDSDDTRLEKKAVRPISVELADGTREVTTEVVITHDSLFPSESLELVRVSPFISETATAHPSQPPKAHHAVDPAARDAANATAAPAQPRNWRNVVLAALGVAVIAQAALMAYWMMSRGGFAALTRQTGSISVTSEPSGSQVSIDGAVRGETPLTIALDAGAHTVVVGTGEQARSQDVSVTRGGDATMHVQLPAAIAAPAVTGKTALQIATEPPGARVWIDGESRGVAPLTVSNLTPGDHAVTVRSGAGDPISRTVTLQQGTTASLVITTPNTTSSFASGYLSIQTPIALQVMENGALLGTTDMPRIMLSAGAHELDLVNAALGFRATRSITIAAGQTASFSVIPPRGTLSINALPWAEVWIDGARVGETPIGNYSIPIGTHELVFRHPELGEQRKTVSVAAQGPVRVGVDMKKP
jgi:hypothetical protein